MKRFLLSLGVAAMATAAIQAEEVTLSIADAADIVGTFIEAEGNTKAHYQPVKSFNIGEYGFACDTTFIASNPPALYHENSTPTLRLYTGSTVTITSPEGAMDMSTITFQTSKANGVSDNNPITCSEGGTITIDGKNIVWVRPETDHYITSVTFNLPTTPDGKTNPNVQIHTVVISNEGGVTPPPAEKPSFVKATEIVSGSKYLIWAEDSIATLSTRNYGYLYITAAPVENGEVKADLENAFTITATEGGYYIQMSDARYLYQKGDYNSFNFSETVPEEGGLWTITFDSEGAASITNVEKQKTVQFDPNYHSFGCYPDMRGILPMLYVEKSAAISSIGADNANAPVEYFNLQGVRVAGDNLPAGIYVRRQGNETSKIIVK